MIKEILRAENITTANNYFPALNNAWLNVRDGETVGLLGLNGSGKSALIKTLCGIRPLARGRIYLNEKPVSFRNYHDAQSHGVFCIDRLEVLFSEMSVADNIFLTNGRNPGPVIREGFLRHKARKLLSSLEIGLSGDEAANQLSSLQQLEVLIAKAVAENARIIIIESILSEFGEEQLGEISALLHRINEKGISLIISDYMPRPLAELCSRIFVLREGSIASVCHTPCDEGLLGTLMVGREPDPMPFAAPSPQEPLEKVFEFCSVADESTLFGLSFSVFRNQVTGILSRDEIINRHIVKLLRQRSGYSGSIRLNGACGFDPKRIGIVPEGDVIFDNLSLFENIILLAQKEYNSPLGLIYRQRIRTIYSEVILPFFGTELKKMRKYDISSLDRVMRKEISICRQLMVNPSVLLLINPTKTLDHPSASAVLKKISELSRALIPSCIISGNIYEQLSICRKIYFIGNGQTEREFDLSVDTPEAVLDYYRTYFVKG
ncbi:ATP-binding cassette domain-containing protein [Christensenella intestinihominis]|uniref:ATP-binding cassette domain-containing protein n=1 Tax=Christensenella intestinihominis TaxID=1851429 RepID=UPI00083214C8|nr:ATP-binding cassette domain-containing protein [Christensenella intestinihominis]